MSRSSQNLRVAVPRPWPAGWQVPGNDQVIRHGKGTAVSNTYQNDRRRAQPDRQPGEIAVPEQVIVSMAAMFGEDAEQRCGPQGKHNPGREGYRHGSEAGSVTLGGRRVP